MRGSQVQKKRMMNGIPTLVCHDFHAPINAMLTATSDSEVSDIEDNDMLDESLFDRIAALKDIVPPTYRKSVSSAATTGYSWASKAINFSGKTLWVVSTSALLLGVPWALAFSEEQQVQEMEREMRMQQNANQVRITTTLIQRMRLKQDLADKHRSC